MVFFAINLKRALASPFFALAARPLNRSRRPLAAAIRALNCCFASCRITTSRSASAILYSPTAFPAFRAFDYAIAEGSLQTSGGRPAAPASIPPSVAPQRLQRQPLADRTERVAFDDPRRRQRLGNGDRKSVV